MKSSNPLFSVERFFSQAYGAYSSEVMTIRGTITKTAILFTCLLATFVGSWLLFASMPGLLLTLVPVCAIACFVMAIVVSFQQQWAGVIAPLYAALEGVVLGTVSAALSLVYPGIIPLCAALTLATFAAMLLIYRLEIIRPTEQFYSMLFAALCGISLTLIVSLVLNLFGVPFLLMDGSLTSIIISGVIVCVAVLSLIADFDFIDKASTYNLPRHMEWYAAFGLMLTIVWIYWSLIRLMMNIARRK